MNLVLNLVTWLIGLVNSIFVLSQKYPIYFVIIIWIIVFVRYRKSYKEAKDFIVNQLWYIILDWKFWLWKTRFLALLAQEAKKNNMIVLCNYYNVYEDVRWGSIKDLIKLLRDMWLLWECQNFTEIEIREMYGKEGKERVKQKIKAIREIKAKYKNIPCNWFYTRFLLQWDEMQNIFYNREAMSNFSWDKKILLKLLHQVRHFNTLCTFALTSASELDLKFRRISNFYLSFGEALWWLFIKYDVYNFDIDKENNFEMDKATKRTKVPVIKLNWYYVNKIINKIEKLIRRRIKFRFKELWFKTKFNADPDVDIYEEWYLFEYLNKYYANNNKFWHIE